MKKLVPLTILVICLIVIFFYLTEKPVKPINKNNAENEGESSLNTAPRGSESENTEQEADIVKTVEKISESSSDAGGGSSGGEDKGGGDEGGDTVEDEENTTGGSGIPDPNVTECGTYFQSHGICDGKCPEGVCVLEGMSCYCKIA